MWNDADDVNSQRFDNTDLSIDARKASIESGDNAQDDQKLSWARIEKAGKLLWSHFKAAYTDKTVLTWSIWWALAMAGFLMIQTYVQLLWQEIDTDRDQFYNAGVEAALTLFGAAGCLVNFLLAPTEVFSSIIIKFYIDFHIAHSDCRFHSKSIVRAIRHMDSHHMFAD